MTEGKFYMRPYPIFLFIGVCLILLSLGANVSAQDLFDNISNEDEKLSVQTVLIPKQQAMIASPRNGEIVTLELFNGDSFSKGDTLIAFRCDIEEARLKQSQARFKASKARYEAQKKLRKLKSTSSLEFLVVEAEYTEAQAVVEEMKGIVDTCVIKAPFDGILTGRQVNPFETVEIGSELIEIKSSDRLQASLLLPSKSLEWLEKGSELTVEIYETGKIYSAEIIRIGGAIDEISQSIEVIAEVQDLNNELLPGMTGVALFDQDVQ